MSSLKRRVQNLEKKLIKGDDGTKAAEIFRAYKAFSTQDKTELRPLIEAWEDAFMTHGEDSPAAQTAIQHYQEQLLALGARDLPAPTMP